MKPNLSEGARQNYLRCDLGIGTVSGSPFAVVVAIASHGHALNIADCLEHVIQAFFGAVEVQVAHVYNRIGVSFDVSVEFAISRLRG